jgi:hypothetical protein
LPTFHLTGHQLMLDIPYRGLGSPLTAAHIHGVAGSADTAGVLIDLAPYHLGTFGSFGSFRGTVTLTPDQRAALVDGKTYVNLHTSGFPAGEVRGQIRPLLEGILLTAMLDGAAERPNPVSTQGNGSAQCLLAGDTLSFIIAYRGLGGRLRQPTCMVRRLPQAPPAFKSTWHRSIAVHLERKGCSSVR